MDYLYITTKEGEPITRMGKEDDLVAQETTQDVLLAVFHSQQHIDEKLFVVRDYLLLARTR